MQLANISNILQQTAAAAERVFEFLEEDEEVEESEQSIKLENVEGHVEFKDVHFGYSPDKIIINDFSAEAEPGHKIAIVGPTGAGKTTMVKLLMRFYDVNSGAILVDGHNIREFSRHNRERCLAWSCRIRGFTYDHHRPDCSLTTPESFFPDAIRETVASSDRLFFCIGREFLIRSNTASWPKVWAPFSRLRKRSHFIVFGS
jgi:energy-coupling factor transporter ATP-binding protein EcfA2